MKEELEVKKGSHKNGVVKNPAFSPTKHKPSDGGEEPRDSDQHSGGGSDNSNQGSGNHGDNDAMDVGEAGGNHGDTATGSGGGAGGSGGGAGGSGGGAEGFVDMFADIGATHDESASNDRSQDKDGKGRVKSELYDPTEATASDEENKDKKEKEVKAATAIDLYDPTEATTDSGGSVSASPKQKELYDPMEATRDSDSNSPAPLQQTGDLYNPEDATKSDHEQEQESNKTNDESTMKEDLYDPEEGTRDSEFEKQETVEAAVAHSPDDSPRSPPDSLRSPPDSLRSPPDSLRSPPDSPRSTPDSPRSTPDSPQSPLSPDGETMHNDEDSQSPSSPADTTPANNAQDKKPQEDCYDPDGELPQNTDSDCPTPLADENGPESPDPAERSNFNLQQAQNTAKSLLAKIRASRGEQDESEDATPLDSPNAAANDITPVLSPVGDDDIPIAKQGDNDDPTPPESPLPSDIAASLANRTKELCQDSEDSQQVSMQVNCYV